MIVPLCNGSTEDFGSFSLGSNPCGTTQFFMQLKTTEYLCGFLL